MAVRDRNLFAWQAYVITMTIISVGLLIGMFFLWRSNNDLSGRFESQGDSLSTAQQSFTESEDRVKRLLSMLGYGDNTEQDIETMRQRFQNDPILGEVEKDFADLEGLFPANQQEKNLMALPELLLDTNRIKSAQLAEFNDKVKALEAQVATKVKSETDRANDAVQRQQTAEADLAKARQDHAAEITRLNNEKEEAFAKFDEYKTLMDKKLTTLTSQNRALVSENKDQKATIDEQAKIINELRDYDFAAPQGEIIRTADGGNTLWINLGRDDGLRVGTPFSVIDESEINITKAKVKAKVVVTNVDNPHMARATLTEKSEYGNPIVTGDKIYSPAWRPGRTVGFALVGKMDMNGDGRDDLDQVQELIRISGGRVDETMDAKGSVSGSGMTPSTSFLVLGTDLTLPDTASPALQEQQRRKRETYKQFIDKARKNGISQISLDKLLGYLKTDSSDRIIPLGDRARGGDFRVRSQGAPPVSQGKVSDIYRPRTPVAK